MRLLRALSHFRRTALTWRAAWKVASNPSAVVKPGPQFRLRRGDDGHLYVEPTP